MKRSVLCGLLFLLIACNNNSKPARSFEATSGLGAFNEYNVVLSLPDGGYMAAGYSITNDDPNLPELPSKGIVALYNAAGELVKTQDVGQSLVNNIRTGVLLHTGEVVLAGTTKSERGDMDVLVVKCSPTGEVIWTQVYGSQVGEEVFDIEETFDNKLVLAGATGSSALFSDEDRQGFIWFLSAEGQMEDEYSVKLGRESLLKDVALLGKTGYFAVGEYSDSNDVSHPLFVSYQTDTVIEFTDSLIGEAISMISVAADSFLVFGADDAIGSLVQWQMNGLTADFQRVSLASAGDIELEKAKRYYGGGYILAANQSDAGAPYYGIALQLYDSKGILLWEKRLKGERTQMLRSVSVTADSGVVIAGFKDIDNEGSKAYIVKLDKDGAMQ